MTTPGDVGDSGLGATIGAKVAAHLARAMVATKVRLGPHQSAIAQQILADFTNHVSDELRSVLHPLWSQIAGSEHASGWVRDLAGRLANERGQAWAWVAGTSTSAAMGSGLLALLTNEMQPVIGRMIAGNPNMPLSVADAAAAVARGVGPRNVVADDAGQWGINDTRFELLVRLAQRVLPPESTLELFARGEMSRDTARSTLRRDGWDAGHADWLLRLARRYPSLADGAAMANRSIVDMEELEEIARLAGHDPSDARKYFELAGEPPAPELLYAAYRREIIDIDRLRRGIVQGPLRNEWFDVVESMQYAPMSAVDAASAVLQGQMSVDDGAVIAKWNGLMPEHFPILIESAGLPPGVELASEALNRGLMTEDEFRVAFLESRLKNRYVDLYMKLRYRVMPQETVRRLYRDGVLTREQAIERLGWAGFSPEDSEALLASEDMSEVTADRDLTASEVVALYENRAIDDTTAIDLLGALGFGAEAAGWKVGLADLRRERRYVDAVIARVKAGYIARRMDYTEAANFMDQLRVPPGQREELISLWDLERDALTKGLTVAQLQTALRRGIIDEPEFIAELETQGYTARAAAILAAITRPPG